VAVLTPNIWGGHGPMASAVARTYTRVWGRSPQRSPGAKPLVRRSGGQGTKPPKAEALLVFGRLMEAANLPTFLKSKNAMKSDICVIFAKKSRVALKLGGRLE